MYQFYGMFCYAEGVLDYVVQSFLPLNKAPGEKNTVNRCPRGKITGKKKNKLENSK